MQATAWPGGVEDKTASEIKCLSLALHRKLAAVIREAGVCDAGLIEVFHAQLPRLADQNMIEVRPIPVRVGHAIVWAGGDEQLVAAGRLIGPGVPMDMMIEREAALETAADFRVSFLPGSPFRERRDLRQVVAPRQFLQQQVGQRR
jgi:hypothetical protein